MKVNLYQFNKDIYKSVAPITDLGGIGALIKKYLQAHPSKYYLMLNNEQKYYTLYTFKDNYKFGKMAAEILDIVVTDLGEIIDISINDNGALEFWIVYKGEPTMFVLFDYTRGVVEI